MAITLIQTPATHTPCFNDQWFTATSSQTAQPNFQFYVTVTVHYHNGTSYTTAVDNEACNLPPDNILRFNVRSYGENYIKHFVQYTTGWSQCLNGVLKIVVNVGERYGTTPAVYTGANTTYYVWNAGLSYNDYAGYAVASYVAVNANPFPILNNYPDTRTNEYSKNFLYILAESDNVISKATIVNNDGVTQTTFDITNTLLASGNWYDRYLRLNVSPYSLAIVGGVNWIAVPGTTYTVQLYNNVGVLKKSINYSYEHVCTKFFRYGMYYLNPKGAFDYCFFEMVSEQDLSIDRTKVKHTPYSDPTASGAMVYTSLTPTTLVYSTQYGKTMKVRSNWLTETQVATLSELIISPVIYLDEVQASFAVFYPVINIDSKYKLNKNFNTKMFNLEANIELAHSNNVQKGV